MKDFNVSVKLIDDPEWYSVADVGFRFWKNHPSDGINYIRLLTKDGVKEIESCFIDKIEVKVW